MWGFFVFEFPFLIEADLDTELTTKIVRFSH